MVFNHLRIMLISFAETKTQVHLSLRKNISKLYSVYTQEALLETYGNIFTKSNIKLSKSF